MQEAKTLLEFGIQRKNEERRDGGCAVVFDPETQLYAVGKRSPDDLSILFSGGVNEGEDIEQGVMSKGSPCSRRAVWKIGEESKGFFCCPHELLIRGRKTKSLPGDHRHKLGGLNVLYCHQVPEAVP